MASPQPVTFKSLGIKIAGHLYRPTDGCPNRKRAAIVIGHPFTSVKEQSPATYGKALAEEGFIALTFDSAYGGESGGEPRGLENPTQRAEDARAAITYLSTLHNLVDPDRIGALGICASGGYIPYAAQTDTRMRAVATISAMCAGRSQRGNSREALNEALTAANKDRLNEYNGKGLTSVSLFPADPEDRKKLPQLMREAYEYYRKPPMQHERAPNTFLQIGSTLAVNYDSFHFNSLISPRPLLMIIGSKADTSHYSEDAISLAEEPKELYVVPDKTHVDLYKDLSGTLPKLVDFYSKYLVE